MALRMLLLLAFTASLLLTVNARPLDEEDEGDDDDEEQNDPTANGSGSGEPPVSPPGGAAPPPAGGQVPPPAGGMVPGGQPGAGAQLGPALGNLKSAWQQFLACLQGNPTGAAQCFPPLQAAVNQAAAAAAGAAGGVGGMGGMGMGMGQGGMGMPYPQPYPGQQPSVVIDGGMMPCGGEMQQPQMQPCGTTQYDKEQKNYHKRHHKKHHN